MLSPLLFYCSFITLQWMNEWMNEWIIVPACEWETGWSCQFSLDFSSSLNFRQCSFFNVLLIWFDSEGFIWCYIFVWSNELNNRDLITEDLGDFSLTCAALRIISIPTYLQINCLLTYLLTEGTTHWITVISRLQLRWYHYYYYYYYYYL